MRFWPISALGICLFFIVAIVCGLSTTTEVEVDTPSYMRGSFTTAPSKVEILPNEGLLLMLAGSLSLIILPVVYELSGGVQFKLRRERSNFGFSLARVKTVELGVSESDLAVIGERTKEAVRQLRRVSREEAAE